MNSAASPLVIDSSPISSPHSVMSVTTREGTGELHEQQRPHTPNNAFSLSLKEKNPCELLSQQLQQPVAPENIIRAVCCGTEYTVLQIQSGMS